MGSGPQTSSPLQSLHPSLDQSPQPKGWGPHPGWGPPMDTESSGLEKNQEGGPSGSQKRGGKLGEQTRQWPCRMALLFPAAALGWEPQPCSCPCRVSRPGTQWHLLTLPLGPALLLWAGLSGRALTEDGAQAGHPSGSRLRVRAG